MDGWVDGWMDDGGIWQWNEWVDKQTNPMRCQGVIKKLLVNVKSHVGFL